MRYRPALASVCRRRCERLLANRADPALAWLGVDLNLGEAGVGEELAVLIDAEHEQAGPIGAPLKKPRCGRVRPSVDLAPFGSAFAEGAFHFSPDDFLPGAEQRLEAVHERQALVGDLDEDGEYDRAEGSPSSRTATWGLGHQ